MVSYDFTPDPLEAAGALCPAPDPGYTYPSDPLVAANLEHWQDQKFGVIIHWGIYAALRQGGSWSLHRDHLGSFTDPPSDWQGSDAEYHSWYQEQARTFTGEEFDAEQWAAACAQAGMKYVVFTAKHHDGYCLYDSAYTNFKSTAEDSGLRRDIFGEVVEAFRARGMQTGVYFSKSDWSRAEYWDRARPISNRFVNYSVEKHPRRWQRFVEFTHDQIEELLTNYGEMNVLWLDAGWVRAPEEPIDIDGIAALARRSQPGILVVDREVHGPHENYRTPEQTVPDQPLGMPWESCLTLTKSWCSMMRDDPTKPTKDMIETLLAVVSRGGNLLLGIGPDATGHMSRHIADSLRQIGEWTTSYGHAIYGTRSLAAPIDQITAKIDGETVMHYAVRMPGVGIAIFFMTGDRPAGTQVEVTGLLPEWEFSALAGEQIKRVDGSLFVHSPGPYACGVELRGSDIT